MKKTLYFLKEDAQQIDNCAEPIANIYQYINIYTAAFHRQWRGFHMWQDFDRGDKQLQTNKTYMFKCLTTKLKRVSP